MKRVTGMGGMFFKARNPKQLAEWYDKHLGLSFGANSYHVFNWDEDPKPDKNGTTVLSFFTTESKYFAPSENPYMMNLRVENLEWLMQALKDEGVEALGDIQAMETIGKFCYIMDPEGNKIELWEPEKAD